MGCDKASMDDELTASMDAVNTPSMDCLYLLLAVHGWGAIGPRESMDGLIKASLDGLIRASMIHGWDDKGIHRWVDYKVGNVRGNLKGGLGYLTQYIL
jgi:hypothetical protein